MNAQIAGSLRGIPSTSFHLPLDFFERKGETTNSRGWLNSNRLKRQIGWGESCPVGKHRRPQNHILQLAHIPRPGVLLQKCNRWGGELEMGKSLGVKEVTGEQWDIFQPFP